VQQIVPVRGSGGTGGRKTEATRVREMAGRYGWPAKPTALICRLEKKYAAFTFHANLKYFLFHPLHRIFKRMHEALNIGKKDN
jgi:hypothetical protein